MNRLTRGLLVAMLALPLATAGPVEAACTQPVKLEYTDPINGNKLLFEPALGKVELTTPAPNSRRLAGERARMQLSNRSAVVTFRSRDLTIMMRADLVNGRLQASAVERLPAYHTAARVKKLRGPDPNRRTYVVSVPKGGPKGNVCLAGPNKTPVSKPRE